MVLLSLINLGPLSATVDRFLLWVDSSIWWSWWFCDASLLLLRSRWARGGLARWGLRVFSLLKWLFLCVCESSWSSFAVLISSIRFVWLSFIIDDSVGSKNEGLFYRAFLASASLFLSSSSLSRLSFSSCSLCFLSMSISLPFWSTVSAMNYFNLLIFMRCLICSLLIFWVSSSSRWVTSLKTLNFSRISSSSCFKRSSSPSNPLFSVVTVRSLEESRCFLVDCVSDCWRIL